MPTLDDTAPAKPTHAENHATAIMIILNEDAIPTARSPADEAAPVQLKSDSGLSAGRSPAAPADVRQNRAGSDVRAGVLKLKRDAVAFVLLIAGIALLALVYLGAAVAGLVLLV